MDKQNDNMSKMTKMDESRHEFLGDVAATMKNFERADRDDVEGFPERLARKSEIVSTKIELELIEQGQEEVAAIKKEIASRVEDRFAVEQSLLGFKVLASVNSLSGLAAYLKVLNLNMSDVDLVVNEATKNSQPACLVAIALGAWFRYQLELANQNAVSNSPEVRHMLTRMRECLYGRAASSTVDRSEPFTCGFNLASRIITGKERGRKRGRPSVDQNSMHTDGLEESLAFASAS